MKIVTRTKCRTVSANSPEDFDEKFNKATEEIGDGVELRWETAPFTVHMLYRETERIAETAKEEYEQIRGIGYHCKDCPHFKLGKDRRYRSEGCQIHVDDLAVDYTRACELFYEELAAGKITPRG